MIIHLISSPRTISTALMYAFDNRNDCIGVDEPLYSYYLSHNDVSHPAREKILESQDPDPKKVFGHIAKINSPFVFIKNMALHLDDVDPSLYSDYFTILLIRNPKNIISSYAKVISNLSLFDLGIQQQYDFATSIGTNNNMLIINSDDILKNPEKMLSYICQAAEIPFSKKMLSWESGQREIDGVWGPYWYQNTHLSTGFIPFKESQIVLQEKQQYIYQEALPYYESLMSMRKY